MPHPAVRLVSTWLATEAHGIDACAALVPRLDGDAAPGGVTVYDELTAPWLALGQLPTAHADETILYPCALVVTGQARFEDGAPQWSPEGRFTEGTVTVVVQLVVRNIDTAAGLRTLMYLLRATRGSLMHLSDNAHDADRTDATGGLTLFPSIGTEQGRTPVKPKGDDIVSAALLVTFPVLEAAPVP